MDPQAALNVRTNRPELHVAPDQIIMITKMPVVTIPMIPQPRKLAPKIVKARNRTLTYVAAKRVRSKSRVIRTKSMKTEIALNA